MNLWNIVNPLKAPQQQWDMMRAPFRGSVDGKPWAQSVGRDSIGAALNETPESVGQKYLGDPVTPTGGGASTGVGGVGGFTVPGSGGAAPGTTSQPISFGQQQQAKGNSVDPQVQQAIGMFLGTLPPLVGIGKGAAGGSAGSPLGGGQVVDSSGTGQLGGGLVNLNPSTPSGTVAGNVPGFVRPGQPVVQN